ncbi:hypothetical protein [Mucilaginibacter sp. FT3.2]|uniref:hypothetical protein n=1 Tax=Mucilaginibacter sp. FT3.2 TaxID=2723090 RepID=UPI001618C484|nr:hypothetical protein [Mucilaginibacter sp. FT3.2]MBB6234024.1 hypothetical protein [Mucilaginibacter sp. FT3.2]
MAAKSAEAQARDFVYELANCASEYGFAKEEIWSVSLVAEKQKAALEKKYYPVISASLTPDMVAAIPQLVAEKLNLVIAGMEATSANQVLKAEPLHLVAYNAGRTM